MDGEDRGHPGNTQSRPPPRMRAVAAAVAFAAFLAVIVSMAASVRHARRAAAYTHLYHEHTALPRGADLLAAAFDRLVDRLKNQIVGRSTEAAREWKERADILEAWRAMRESRAWRGAALAALASAVFAFSLAWFTAASDGRRGLVFAALLLASAALAAGAMSPCLSFRTVYPDLPLLGTVTLTTSISGVRDALLHLWRSGNASLAALFFVFSLLFPAMKTLLMFIAFWRTDRGGKGLFGKSNEWAGKLGKWSMLDVMVTAFLFVQLSTGGLSSARLEPGAYFFCAHIGLAMLSSALLKRTLALRAPDAPPKAGPGLRSFFWRAHALAAKCKVRAAVCAACLLAGSAWIGWQSHRGLSPVHELSWTAEWIAPQSSFWRDRPFAIQLAHAGLPGLLDATARLETSDGRKLDTAIPVWPAAAARAFSIPGQDRAPDYVTLRLVSADIGEHAIRFMKGKSNP